MDAIGDRGSWMSSRLYDWPAMHREYDQQRFGDGRLPRHAAAAAALCCSVVRCIQGQP